MATYKIGQQVHVKDKDVFGRVAYIGSTDFAPGVWVGIILDEPKGKNNGSVQGKSYFECQDKHGKNLYFKKSCSFLKDIYLLFLISKVCLFDNHNWLKLPM